MITLAERLVLLDMGAAARFSTALRFPPPVGCSWWGVARARTLNERRTNAVLAARPGAGRDVSIPVCTVSQSPKRRLPMSLSVRLAAMLVFLLSLTVASAAQCAQGGPERYAALVMNAKTGEILFDRHARETRYPASITKVMTLYMVFDALEQGRLSLDDQVRMSVRAASQPPSKLGLAAGRSLSVEEAIQALAVRSANDVAVALAEHLSGSVEAFGRASTLRAHELGMVQTTFVNPHGLPDPRHVSTALDLALLSHAVWRDYPQYYRYFGQDSWSFEGRVIRTTNGLLSTHPDVDGIKTGFTRASGYNLAASSIRGDLRLITVVLGGRTSASRNAHVSALMATGFDAEAAKSMGHVGTPQAFFESRGFGLESAGDSSLVPAGPVPAQALQAGLVVEARDEISGLADARRRQIESDTRGGWAVQVGAFRDPEAARNWLATVSRRFPQLVQEGRVSVESSGPWHRSRILGLEPEAAGRACETLTSAGLNCLVLQGGAP